MSSKVHRSAALPVEPMTWPTANSMPVPQPTSEIFPSRGSTSTPDAHENRQGGRSRQSANDVDQRAQAAYAQGHQDGALSAQREAEVQVRAVTERLARSIEEITGMRQRLRHEAEEDVVALAIAIARRVLHREITMDPEALLGLAKAALEKIDVRELHRVRMHPQSAPLLQEHLEKIGLPRRVEVFADPGLERGAVILETGRGTLDASVESQLVEIERGFADMVRHAQ